MKAWVGRSCLPEKSCKYQIGNSNHPGRFFVTGKGRKEFAKFQESALIIETDSDEWEKHYPDFKLKIGEGPILVDIVIYRDQP